ncbi:alpha/beta hydrolase [Thalassoroseus pseudoceratinae]|uniref:alpha/beta hydrolase n=1 Tax=Thalassoroseus pseudoceratinae TaxID=2713176 RepID=UPI0014226F47|nr:alpha/beta hydrolase [Thalassoroseus pseudoceratinae]
MVRLSAVVVAVIGLIGVGSATVSAADDHPVYEIWPDGAPGETGDIPAEKAVEPPADSKRPVTRIHNVTNPTLTVYKAPKDKDTGTSVVICPGGGYNILAWDLEGVEVAEWLNSIGVTGVVLKYRVPRRKDRLKHEAPLQDAQRAVRFTRAHAKEWGINPDRIGILGFSAGGHLSTTTLTNSDRSSYKSIDEIDEQSSKPDFGVLIYPAYLTGERNAKTYGKELSEEIRVTKDTPPIFMAHAYDDRITPADTARLFIALKEAGVPAELHIYNSGGHGFGLRTTDNPVSSWPGRCEDWMRIRGLLKKSK